MGEGQPLMEFNNWIAPEMTATHSINNAPDLDILFVPGGGGSGALYAMGETWIEDFIASKYKDLEYLCSVCTGSGSLALSGVLNGKKATTNKSAYRDVLSINSEKNITWVPTARWVVDGNIWTSSGVAAGK